MLAFQAGESLGFGAKQFYGKRLIFHVFCLFVNKFRCCQWHTIQASDYEKHGDVSPFAEGHIVMKLNR